MVPGAFADGLTLLGAGRLTFCPIASQSVCLSGWLAGWLYVWWSVLSTYLSVDRLVDRPPDWTTVRMSIILFSCISDSLSGYLSVLLPVYLRFRKSSLDFPGLDALLSVQFPANQSVCLPVCVLVGLTDWLTDRLILSDCISYCHSVCSITSVSLTVSYCQSVCMWCMYVCLSVFSDWLNDWQLTWVNSCRYIC